MGFGQALSMIFKDKNLLKRTYEFFANPKAEFDKLTKRHWQKTATDAQAERETCVNLVRFVQSK